MSRVDDKRYGYEDFSSFQGMRVGIIRGSSDGERFQRYCEKFGVKPIIVPYAETQALLSALRTGRLTRRHHPPWPQQHVPERCPVLSGAGVYRCGEEQAGFARPS